MPDDKNLQNLYVEYLSKYNSMALATGGGAGGVDCATVYYAHDSEGAIYFVTDKSTGKAKNLAASKQVALAIDDGGSSAMGVKVRGTVEQITDPKQMLVVREMLISRIPALAPFMENPNLQFFKVLATRRFLINFAWGIDWRVEVLD